MHGIKKASKAFNDFLSMPAEVSGSNKNVPWLKDKDGTKVSYR
jgi:hypothetical protein